jgi:hypothetical protein
MDTKNVEKFLESFGENVIDKAKINMANSKDSMGKARGNTAIGKSIRFEVVPTATGFTTKFYMLDYGDFLDKGVSGNKKKHSFTNYKNATQSSPYSYTTKGPPIDILSKWIKKKGIKPKGLGRGRSKTYKSKSGKTVKGTGQYLSGFAYLISRKIKREGIKSLSFFQKPLGIGYEKLQKELLTELKLDIETYLTTFYRPK